MWLKLNLVFPDQESHTTAQVSSAILFAIFFSIDCLILAYSLVIRQKGETQNG